jgi:hypothetical protein
MDSRYKNINHVRILAKQQAQKNQEDQRIFETFWKGYKVFDFLAAKDKKRGVELVQYARKVERKDVLQDNGDREPRPVTKRQVKKSKAS